MNISDKILNLAADLGPKQKELKAQQERLAELTDEVAKVEDAEKEEVLLAEIEEVGKSVDTLTADVEKLDKRLGEYREIEKRQAVTARPAAEQQTGGPALIKPEREQSKGLDVFVRHAVVTALSHAKRIPEQQVMDELYGDDLRLKSVMPLITKTEAPIATTTDTGYAAELVQDDLRGLLEEIESQSVAAALSLWASRSGGMLVNFGRAQSITIPRLNPTGATPTEPAWVREGGAIPVGSISIGSQTINRYKLAEILVTTMELRERSVTDIEAVFRRAMQRAYVKVLDNALLSNAAAVAGVRPAGLLNGLAGANTGAGDATGGIPSVVADIKALVGALLAANENAVPVLLLNNQTRMGLTFQTDALGMFTFRDDLNSGNLLTVPVISSGNVPADVAVMVDASSLAMALDAPMFDISQVATVVMANADGTAPTMADDGAGLVGTAGQVQQGINVVPNPGGAAGAQSAGYYARSMFQTYSEAVRMIAPTSWALLRPSVVAQRTAIAW
jgi:HK97 family phage major capsid protein